MGRRTYQRSRDKSLISTSGEGPDHGACDRSAVGGGGSRREGLRSEVSLVNLFFCFLERWGDRCPCQGPMIRGLWRFASPRGISREAQDVSSRPLALPLPYPAPGKNHAHHDPYPNE